MIKLTRLEEKVLEELRREGRATAPMLAERVGTTPASVRTVLVRLSKVGLVKRVARGVYEPAGEKVALEEPGLNEAEKVSEELEKLKGCEAETT